MKIIESSKNSHSNEGRANFAHQKILKQIKQKLLFKPGVFNLFGGAEPQ